MEHPDPDLHQKISFIKSAVRIGACLFALIIGNVYPLAFGLLFAEIIGIYEELV